jgi:translocation and assembly module TamB
LPRSLENINGRIGFDSLGINVDQLHATMGSGDVAFGGNISLKGLVPSEFNLTAAGRAMRLRYPQGFETTVDADLQLRGPIGSPTLSGTVDVVHSTFMRQIEADLTVLLAGGAAGAVPAPPITSSDTNFPLTFEIRVQAPPIAIIDVKDMKIYGHIDALWYRGTLDRPILQGRIEIDSGQIFFGGNRYAVKGGSIDFSNPNKIEPFFDLELETRLRALGQTYIANLRTIGTFEHINFQLTSDPVLPQYDILSLMLGESPDVGTAEQRALRSPQEAQNQAFRTLMAQLVTAPLSSRVGSVVEKTGALDTVQISPLLGNQTSVQQLTPGAKLTLGKRISSNVYLTYSRTLNQQQLEVIVLEFDQSDRVSWVLSKNEDHTFSLDFRIRHVF